MKKIKIQLETGFRASREIEDPFELISAFFDYYKVDHYKNTLSEIMLHVHRAEVCRQDHPGEVFDFYTAVKSFIRAAHRLTFKQKNGG